LKQSITRRFDDNLERVRGLVALYESLGTTGSGRRPTNVSDVLRAAVVMLHATLEDLIRSLLEWRLPTASSKVLADIPLPGKVPGKKHDLGDVAEFRGRSVDDLIRDAVQTHLSQSNYNDMGQVVSALKSVGLRSDAIQDEDKTRLIAMMKRRHWIVHRLDVNPTRGSGQHAAQSLGVQKVLLWLEAVNRVGRCVLDQLDGTEEA
jgi:Arc/MetJ-type ribon-helix-helix transcriptional regulator